MDDVCKGIGALTPVCDVAAQLAAGAMLPLVFLVSPSRLTEFR